MNNKKESIVNKIAALARWYQEVECGGEIYTQNLIKENDVEYQEIYNILEREINQNIVVEHIVEEGNHIKMQIEDAARVVIQEESNNIDQKALILSELENIDSLEGLALYTKNFQHCSLKEMAINTVFADGNPTSKIMLIGEAPGATEDEQGIPFCGQSGKLLDNIFASIGITRQQLYITNTVFWRPPGNRRPTIGEIEICRPIVEKHIALVNPKLIIMVGNTAVFSLLNIECSMHSARNKYYQYDNRYLKEKINTAVIFHPSYLLRQPSKKKEMWFDIQRIMYNFPDILC